MYSESPDAYSDTPLLHTDPGALRIDTVDQQWTSARAPVHCRLPGVAFNHEGEPVCDAATFKAWAKDDFADLRYAVYQTHPPGGCSLTNVLEVPLG